MPVTPATPFNLGQLGQPNPLQVPTSTHLEPTFILPTPLQTLPSQQPVAQDPTQPWMDLEYASLLPVVPQVRPTVYNSACPAFGFHNGFNVSDLNRSGDANTIAIASTSVTASSNVLDAGSTHQDIFVSLSDVTATCSVNVYLVDTVNGNVLIKTYDNINRFCTGMYVGGHDGIALSGAQLVYEVLNITNSATVQVNIQTH